MYALPLINSILHVNMLKAIFKGYAAHDVNIKNKITADNLLVGCHRQEGQPIL